MFDLYAKISTWLKIAKYFLLATLVVATLYPHGQLSAMENLQIVDCSLPKESGELKAAKLSADECAARKGKFVPHHKADYRSALRVWEPLALRGNTQAQYHLGEIYENGMGREPNKKLAAVWYLLAAEKGYTPAQMTIGRLYEAGEGVEKNLTKAMSWYQKASGLSDDEVKLETAVTETKKSPTSQSKLSESVAAEQKALKELDKQLIDAQKQLEESELLAEKLNRDVRRINIRIKRLSSPIKRNSTLIKKNSVPIKGLKQRPKKEKKPNNKDIKVELVKDELELENQAQRNVALKTELSLVKADVKAENYLQDRVTQANAELRQEKDTVLKFKDRLIAVNQSLSDTPSDQHLKIYQDYLENELKLLKQKSSTVPDNKHKKLIEQLIAEIKQRQPDLELASDEGLFKDSFYQSQLAILTTNLNEKEKTLAVLSDRLQSARQETSDRKAYIAKLEKEVAQSQQKLSQQQKKITEKQEKLNAAEQQIASLNLTAEQSSVKKADADSLKVELEQKEKDLAFAQSESKKLLDNLKQLEQKKQQLSEKISNLVPEEPVIALRWPENKKVEGVYQSTVAAGSIVNIIGAVSPHQLIDSLLINGQDESIDENGLFLKNIEVANEPVYIEFVVRTNTGKSNKQLLVLEPDASIQSLPVAIQPDQFPQVNFGDYYALVIGNSAYNEQLGWEKLDTTVNDAQAVSKLLAENYGFKVTTKLDADRDTLLQALETIRRQLTEKDNLLIYYAGHGYVDPENDQGYWIPVDGSVDSSVKWISNSTITDQIRAMTARNVMVVADSCYSSTLMRSGVISLRSGLSPQKKLQRLNNDIKAITRVALSAGGLQPVADSIDNSGHSVFANAFLSVLNQNEAIIDGDSLATEVGFKVTTATQDTIKQVPRYAPLARGGHQGGEFYFVPKGWKHSDI